MRIINMQFLSPRTLTQRLFCILDKTIFFLGFHSSSRSQQFPAADVGSTMDLIFFVSFCNAKLTKEMSNQEECGLRYLIVKENVMEPFIYQGVQPESISFYHDTMPDPNFVQLECQVQILTILGINARIMNLQINNHSCKCMTINFY